VVTQRTWITKQLQGKEKELQMKIKKTREQREAASLQREKDYKVQMIQEDHVLHAAGNTQIQMIPDWLTNGSSANSAINGTIKRVLRRMACLMIYSFTASHVVRQFFFIFHEPEL